MSSLKVGTSSSLMISILHSLKDCKRLVLTTLSAVFSITVKKDGIAIDESIPNTPITINEKTNGLEIAFSITGAGLFVEGGGNGARGLLNQPIYAYAGDFVPTFKKF